MTTVTAEPSVKPAPNKTVMIGLSNPKSPTNVGAVIRAAGCFKADGVFYTGERYPRAAKFHTDTKSAARSIGLTGVASLLDAVPVGASVVCVELVEGAISLPQFKHPDNAFYIFGPEDGTLEQDLVDRADAVVYIPTVGCLNLAATVNVVLYDRIAKSSFCGDGGDGGEGADILGAGDALIRRSRDRNNRLKVNG
ncbi:MAG: RNA methyltransferase [Motiliproteus sp.]